MAPIILRPDGHLVSLLRQRAGYSQSTLAAEARRVFRGRGEGELRCSSSTVARIESRDGYRPHESVIWALAAVLKVSVDELCGLTVTVSRPDAVAAPAL